MKRSILIIMLCIIATAGNAQLPLELSRMNRQKAFKKAVPAGNYSGITRFAGNHYALVSDKADQMGFYLFTIDIDSITPLVAIAVAFVPMTFPAICIHRYPMLLRLQ